MRVFSRRFHSHSGISGSKELQGDVVEAPPKVNVPLTDPSDDECTSAAAQLCERQCVWKSTSVVVYF